MGSAITKNLGYYGKAFLCVLIMFGFGYLPPIEPITPLGMHIVGIFLCINTLHLSYPVLKFFPY